MSEVRCSACESPIITNEDVVAMANEGHPFWCQDCLAKYFHKDGRMVMSKNELEASNE